MMTTTDNQEQQTAKTRRGQASKMKRHQKHKAKKAQHAATGQHGWRCEYNSTRCDDDDEKTAPQMVRGAGHTFLFAFWLSTHFAGVCRSFQEFSGVAIPPPPSDCYGHCGGRKRRAFDQTTAKRHVQKSGKTITQGGLEPELGQCKIHVKKQ